MLGMAPGFLYPESTVALFMAAGLLKCLQKYPTFKDVYIKYSQGE